MTVCGSVRRDARIIETDRIIERHSRIGSLVRWGLIGGAIGGVLNVVLHACAAFGLGDPMAGDGGMGFMEIPIFMSFAGSVAPGAIAALVYAALERLAARPTARFLQVSGAFLVVSLAAPTSMQGTTTVTVVVLSAMHVIAGVGIMWGSSEARVRKRHASQMAFGIDFTMCAKSGVGGKGSHHRGAKPPV